MREPYSRSVAAREPSKQGAEPFTRAAPGAGLCAML